MLAIRQRRFGPPEVLEPEDVPDPAPGTGRARIAVEAAGVHVIDTAIRAGADRLPFPLPDLPMTPGREVAGVVDAVGPGVDPAWEGRRAVAHLGLASGGYAQLAVAPAEALHEVPDGLGADVAVAAIGTGRTAVAILDQAAIAPDDVVLVTAAAGGLGGLFIQGVRAAGAVAVGAAGGAEKVAAVRALGADVAVDYREPDWPERVVEALDGRRVSVALDGVGGALGRAALELLAPGGRILLFGFSSGEPTPLTTRDLMRLGITASWALGGGIAGRMRELETRALADAAAGRLVPVVGQRFPLADAAGAHRAIEARETIGKVVLVP
ncbi:MAG: zinc-binding dehydrogenase [Thermoleophilia bacterium]